MLHPLFSTLVQRPDLVVDHASGYAALFHEEASAAGAELLRKAVACALSVLSGLMFLGLGGIALMLGAIHNQFHWMLVAVPAVALTLAVVAAFWASKPFKGERFPQLRAQVGEDVRALRMAA